MFPVEPWAASSEVLVLAASESCEADHTELLQASAGRKEPDRSPAGLKDLASRLVKAKEEQLGLGAAGRVGEGDPFVVGDG